MERDQLYYEVWGSGRPLLMIAGGGGDAGYYTLVAEILSDEYQVIAYDRRGHSRSTRRDPQNFEIGQQARDAVAVLAAAGHESALVFGNSGGAIIALEMARTHPEAVDAMVVHEPPVIRVLPDADKWLLRYAELYLLARQGDTQGAMEQFLATTAIDLPSFFAVIPQDFAERTAANRDFFATEEMHRFTAYKPDVEAIRENGVKAVMAAGEKTLDVEAYYGMTAPILAEALGCPMVSFPGDHISYMDMPEEWAAALRTTLHELVA